MINKDFKSILDLINSFPNEETCVKHLEELRWNGRIVSSFDSSSKVYKTKNGYRCKNTSKYFNVKTGTLFDNTKVNLQKWFIAIWLVTSHKKSISSMQLAKDIHVTQKTAWFMLQRIRACFDIENNDNDHMLDNTVEIDETYIGGKNKNRYSDKKVPNSQGRGSKDKTPVIGTCIVGDVRSETLTKEVIRMAKDTANPCSDEWIGYKGISRIYDHSIVKHNKGQYIKGRIHTNTIEVFWSFVKKRIVGIYHFTLRKHLQRYANEFVFSYDTRNSGVNLLVANTGVRTAYKGLING